MILSIVVPVYNTHREKLSRCLESICGLKGVEYEVILVNDGSDKSVTDWCVNYVKKHFRIIHLYQDNAGVSVARNRGIENAKGDYVMFVDSDDEIVPMSIIEGLYEVYPDALPDIVVFDRLFIKGRKVRYQKALTGDELDKNILLRKMLTGTGKLGSVHGILYKSKFLKENNLTFNSTTIQQEDRDFNFSVIKSSPTIKHIGRAAYRYYYQLTSAVYRWKRQPDKMIDGGGIRYRNNREYILESDWDDKESLLNRLDMKRICSLYENAVDLYCAKKMTEQRKKYIQSLMSDIAIPMTSGKEVKRKHADIIQGKWIRIALYAKLRWIYMRGVDLCSMK